MATYSPESPAIRLLLGALIALTALSIDIVLPALPGIAAGMGREAEAGQMILTGYLVGFAAGQLVVGPLADRFGRRPVLIGGMALFTIAGIGCAVADSIGQLTTLRFLQGLGGSAGPVLARTIVRDLFEREEGARVLSYVMMVMTAAPILAPVIGAGLLGIVGWRGIFFGLALYGAVVLAMTVLRLGETAPRRDPTATRPGRILANWRAFLGSRAGAVNALVIALTFTGMFAYIAGSPAVIIEVYGHPAWMQAAIFGGVSATLLIASLVNGRSVARLGIDRMLGLGQGLVAAGGLLALGATLADLGLWPIVGGIAVYVLGCGFTFPNATAAAMQPHPTIAGVAASLLGFVQMICGALGSLVVMALYDGTALAMTLVMAAGGLTSLAVNGLRRRVAQAAGE